MFFYFVLELEFFYFKLIIDDVKMHNHRGLHKIIIVKLTLVGACHHVVQVQKMLMPQSTIIKLYIYYKCLKLLFQNYVFI